MSNIELYSLIPSNLNRGLEKMGINLISILPPGSKNINDVIDEIKANPNFCRNEMGINYTHFVSLISSDISIYALLDGKIAGLLAFMILDDLEGRKILLHGLCSPIEYANKGIGKTLVQTLIRIGKLLNVDNIELQCRGDSLMKYYSKFGFIVKYKNMGYDSDDDDEDHHVYYNMCLNLSTTTGGKKKSKKFKKSSKKRIKQNTRRKLINNKKLF